MWYWWIPIVIIGVLGLVRVIAWLIWAISCTERQCLRWTKNFQTHYGNPGKDSYVLVTGGSDGIGLSIVHMLAARGFNIIMVARNQSKMDEKVAEVKKKYPERKYMTIVADFSKMQSIKEYRTLIADKVKNLDIAMIFLNAGVAQMGCFSDLDDSMVEDLMTVNAVHPMYLAKALISQQLARGKKSAIVVTSSTFG